MSDVLSRKYKPLDRTCAEQDFWSWFFAVHWHERLGELDVSLNFQIHQLSVSVPDAPRGSRWMELARNPVGISIWHFSAIPKPSNLLIGNVVEEAGHMKMRKCDADITTDTNIDINTRVACSATRIYEHQLIPRMLVDAKHIQQDYDEV